MEFKLLPSPMDSSMQLNGSLDPLATDWSVNVLVAMNFCPDEDLVGGKMRRRKLGLLI